MADHLASGPKLPQSGRLLRALTAAPDHWQPALGPLLDRVIADSASATLRRLDRQQWRVVAERVIRWPAAQQAGPAAALLATAAQRTGQDRALAFALAPATIDSAGGFAVVLAALRSGRPVEQLRAARALAEHPAREAEALRALGWSPDPQGRPWNDRSLSAISIVDHDDRETVLWFDADGAERARWSLAPGASLTETPIGGVVLTDAAGSLWLYGLGHAEAVRLPDDVFAQVQARPSPMPRARWVWQTGRRLPAPGMCVTTAVHRAGAAEHALREEESRLTLDRPVLLGADRWRLLRLPDYSLELVEDASHLWRTAPLPEVERVVQLGRAFVATGRGIAITIDRETGAVTRRLVGSATEGLMSAPPARISEPPAGVHCPPRHAVWLRSDRALE